MDERKLEFEIQVYNNQIGADGVLRDPYNPDIVLDLKPGQPRKGKVDFGHKPDKEYYKMFEKYVSKEMSLDDLKAFQFNPNNFQIEFPSTNRSREYQVN